MEISEKEPSISHAALHKNAKNTFFQKCIYYYLLIMFGIFPIYCTDKYFNIPMDRFNFFLYATIGLFLLLLISAIIESHRKNSIYSKDTIVSSFVNTVKPLSLTDYAMIALMICCTLSTVFSKYPKESFTGQLGRHNGLLLFMLYFIAYFMVSRGFKYQSSIFLVLMATSSCMFLMAILQQLGFDVLGFYQGVGLSEQSVFISTIGNINFFSSFVLLALPVSCCLYCMCKSKSLRIVCYISMQLAFCGVIVGNSDTGFWGLAVLFFVLIFYCIKNSNTLKRYCEVLFSFLISTKLLSFLILLRPNQSHKFRGIYKFLMNSNLVSVFMIFVVAAWIFFHYLSKNKIDTAKLFRKLKMWIISLFIIVLSIFALCFIWFSFIDTKSNIGTISTYLRFNYSWGSKRGLIWITGIHAFKNFNAFQKLFGYGMDMFSTIISHKVIFSWNNVDNAHNEFIEYLVSIGIVGLLSYLTFTLSQVIKCFKNSIKKPILFVCATSILCYLAQSTGNFAQTMVTPLFIIMIAIAESLNRGIQKKSNSKIS